MRTESTLFLSLYALELGIVSQWQIVNMQVLIFVHDVSKLNGFNLISPDTVHRNARVHLCTRD